MIKVTKGQGVISGNTFPKIATLGGASGGVFIALSSSRILCLDPGNSGWGVGQYDEDEDFRWNDDNFKDLNEPITIQNA